LSFALNEEFDLVGLYIFLLQDSTYLFSGFLVGYLFCPSGDKLAYGEQSLELPLEFKFDQTVSW